MTHVIRTRTSKDSRAEFEKQVHDIGYEFASGEREDFLGEVCYVLVKRSAALDQMFKLVRSPSRGGLATRFFGKGK
jgi:hypothetical protein